jgi:thiamine biosynthesis lipoprotein
LAALALILAGCGRPLPAQSEFVLGTICTINLFDQGSAPVYRAVFERLREIEDRMSVNREDTEAALVNRQAGIEPVTVHGDLLEVLERALYYAALSGGAFDPTVGPLVKLWGIGTDEPRLPSPEEIDQVRSLVGWEDLRIDRSAGTAFLTRSGMSLDLGGIAKGYAADEAARIIRGAGIERALIDLGGNILILGQKKDGTPWRVGIQNPGGVRGEYAGILELSNHGETISMVTSGVYERYAEIDGRRYHHILSPREGRPAETGLLSVTIIAPLSMDADTLSTAVFVLGYEAGKALVESLEDVEALFILEDFSIRGTAGALGKFELIDGKFSLAP